MPQGHHKSSLQALPLKEQPEQLQPPHTAVKGSESRSDSSGDGAAHACRTLRPRRVSGEFCIFESKLEPQGGKAFQF